MTDTDTPDITDVTTLEYTVYRSEGDVFLSPPHPDDLTAGEWDAHCVFAEILGANDVPRDPQLGDFVGIQLLEPYTDAFAPGETVDGIDVLTRTAPIVMDKLKEIATALVEAWSESVGKLGVPTMLVSDEPDVGEVGSGGRDGDEDDDDMYHCPECGFEWGGYDRSPPYANCPACGVMMRRGRYTESTHESENGSENESRGDSDE